MNAALENIRDIWMVVYKMSWILSVKKAILEIHV